MAMTSVTVVTRNASTDDITDDDYRDIFCELREQHPLRQFARLAQTGYSIAWWSKFERGEVELTRAARNELRRAVGLPALPLTIGEAAAIADPDATVYRVGDGVPDVVILAAHRAPLVMSLNGALNVVEDVPSNPRVTTVTRATRRKSVHVGVAIWERLNSARQAAGLTWDEYLGKAVES
jgi:transcriptional regulator with XRE-family HTH domain